MKWTYIPLVISGILIGTAAYPSIQQVSLEEAQKAALATIGKNTDSRLLSTNTNNKIRIVNQFTESEHTLMYEVVFEDNSAVLLSGSKACPWSRRIFNPSAIYYKIFNPMTGVC